jgi:hypothetical protein
MVLVHESSCLLCNKSSDIFNVLKDFELDKINCARVNLKYRPGEVIFKQGAPANFLYA